MFRQNPSGYTREGAFYQDLDEPVGQFTNTIQQVHEGMEVVSSDGEQIGTVKDIHERDFWLYRTAGKDLYVPSVVVKSVDTQVHLEITAGDIDQQDWAKPGENLSTDPFI